jgi:hypothetical protein
MHEVVAWLDGVTGGRANLVLFVLGAVVFVLGHYGYLGQEGPQMTCTEHAGARTSA